jgi:hypothetical protein
MGPFAFACLTLPLLTPDGVRNMTWEAMHAASLADIVGDRAATFERDPIADARVGFDAVVQFSRRLLETQISSSLAERGLSPLATELPWGLLPVPQSLLAKLPQAFVRSLLLREARLELRLLNPHIVSLAWPLQDIATGSQPGTMSAVSPNRRIVTVAWQLELSVLTAREDLATDILPSGRANTAPGRSVANIDFDAPLAIDFPPVTAGPSWSRAKFATGKVTFQADARLISEPHLWRFGMWLDLSAATPTLASDEPALIDFLTGAGQSLLAGAVATLRAADVRLTPQAAPAGALSAATIQRLGMPGFQVIDRVLTSRDGAPILCLCVQRDGTTGGAPALLRPFLERSDFGYAVSTALLKPALKARWALAAGGVSLASEMQVELPVDETGTETEIYRAQLLVQLANALDDVTIRASLAGDNVVLIGRQTVQLLNLWRENGDRVADLGELGRPEESPLGLMLQLFGPAGAAPVRAELRSLMTRLMPALAYPLLQRVAVNGASIAGFVSSPLQTLLVKWRLKTIFDDIATSTDNPILTTRSLDG